MCSPGGAIVDLVDNLVERFFEEEGVENRRCSSRESCGVARKTAPLVFWPAMASKKAAVCFGGPLRGMRSLSMASGVFLVGCEGGVCGIVERKRSIPATSRNGEHFSRRARRASRSGSPSEIDDDKITAGFEDLAQMIVAVSASFDAVDRPADRIRRGRPSEDSSVQKLRAGQFAAGRFGRSSRAGRGTRDPMNICRTEERMVSASLLPSSRW